jgi:hypothetical protein
LQQLKDVAASFLMLIRADISLHEFGAAVQKHWQKGYQVNPSEHLPTWPS